MMNEQHFTEDSDKPDAQSQFLIDLDLNEVKQSQAEIFYSVREIINKYDPARLIVIGAPEDEYDPEVKTIVYQLKDVRTIAEIQDLVYQEFLRWFEEKSIVGEWDSYAEIAYEIHQLLMIRKNSIK